MTMLTEALDHVIGVDPDRDRLTIAVIDTATTGVVARTVVGADPAAADRGFSPVSITEVPQVIGGVDCC